jgi:hypothetical protein
MQAIIVRGDRPVNRAKRNAQVVESIDGIGKAAAN